MRRRESSVEWINADPALLGLIVTLLVRMEHVVFTERGMRTVLPALACAALLVMLARLRVGASAAGAFNAPTGVLVAGFVAGLALLALTGRL
ncbi:MAG TPA: hypothetical protein VEC19_20120 [Usitatibacter sp.]|nr:hypothetical protein [Usitatibacter sp.]